MNPYFSSMGQVSDKRIITCTMATLLLALQGVQDFDPKLQIRISTSF